LSQTVYEIKKENFSSLTYYRTDRRFNLKWPSVFVLPFWLQTWWEHFGKDYELSLISIWKEKTLAGIAPLKLKHSTASLLGSPDVCDYLDFIILPGKENFFFKALFQTLDQKGIKRLELSSQRPEGAIFGSFFAENKVEGWTGSFEEENSSSELYLEGSWDAYLAGLHKKQRHEVRRKIRKLENETQSFSYQCLAEKDEVLSFIPLFMELFLQSPEKQNFMTSEMYKFFQHLITAAAETGLARFGLLEVEGRNVAAVLYFDYQNKIYLYNSGYESEYHSLSVGLLAKIFCIRDSIERGKQVFDFLKGREIYKTRLGGNTVPIYKVTLEKAAPPIEGV
jgi:hypothetical protein